LEVDQAVAPLVAAAAKARGDPAGVIAAAGRALAFEQGALGLLLGEPFPAEHLVVATRGRGRLVTFDTHVEAPSKKSIDSPDLSDTIAFFQLRVLAVPRPMRRMRPRTIIVCTFSTLTLNSVSTALRISTLLAPLATSNRY